MQDTHAFAHDIAQNRVKTNRQSHCTSKTTLTTYLSNERNWTELKLQYTDLAMYDIQHSVSVHDAHHYTYSRVSPCASGHGKDALHMYTHCDTHTLSGAFLRHWQHPGPLHNWYLGIQKKGCLLLIKKISPDSPDLIAFLYTHSKIILLIPLCTHLTEPLSEGGAPGFGG